MRVSGYICYVSLYSDVSNNIFFDKNSNRELQLDSKNVGLNDDIIIGPGFIPKSCNGQKFISWFSPYELKGDIKSKDFEDMILKNHKKKEDLKILVNSLQHTDNPVLVFETPKKVNHKSL